MRPVPPVPVLCVVVVHARPPPLPGISPRWQLGLRANKKPGSWRSWRRGAEKRIRVVDGQEGSRLSQPLGAPAGKVRGVGPLHVSGRAEGGGPAQHFPLLRYGPSRRHRRVVAAPRQINRWNNEQPASQPGRQIPVHARQPAAAPP
eukprot:COSAG01_NODE_11498_length_1921_cov_4.789243_1_plen_145_part_10